jgi:hypothetical protein
MLHFQDQGVILRPDEFDLVYLVASDINRGAGSWGLVRQSKLD